MSRNRFEVVGGNQIERVSRIIRKDKDKVVTWNMSFWLNTTSFYPLSPPNIEKFIKESCVAILQ